MVAGSCMGPATTSACEPAALRSAISCAKTSFLCSSSMVAARELDASASAAPMPSSLATMAAKTAMSLRRSANRSSALMPVTVTDGSTTYMRDCACLDGSLSSMRRPLAHARALAMPTAGQPKTSASRTRMTLAASNAGMARNALPKAAVVAATEASVDIAFHEAQRAFGYAARKRIFMSSSVGLMLESTRTARPAPASALCFFAVSAHQPLNAVQVLA